MPSFSRTAALLRAWLAVAGLAMGLLAACAQPAARADLNQAKAPIHSAPICSPVGAGQPPGPQAAAELRTWQAQIEGLPLFAAAAAASASQCSFERPADGPMRLFYRFANGNTLQALRDARIELLDHTATFARPLAADPLALLQAGERATYGPAGCGIDWLSPETAPARNTAGSASVSRTIYRGDACNCQAIVQRRADGQVSALTLKSAC